MSAPERKTRSFQTTGEFFPGSGTSTFHAMFFPEAPSQSVGGSCWTAVPFPPGPRNCGQLAHRSGPTAGLVNPVPRPNLANGRVAAAGSAGSNRSTRTAAASEPASSTPPVAASAMRAALGSGRSFSPSPGRGFGSRFESAVAARRQTISTAAPTISMMAAARFCHWRVKYTRRAARSSARIWPASSSSGAARYCSRIASNAGFSSGFTVET